MYTLCCDNMPNVTAGNGRFSDSIAFFENLQIKLHQTFTDYVLR